MSQQAICWHQPTWQMQQFVTAVTKNNTHTLESLQIFLESNYKEKLVEKVRQSIYFNIYLCVVRNFNKYNKHCEIFQSVTRTALPKLDLLTSYLLEDEFSFFSACWIYIINFFCTQRIWAMTLMHCWWCCHFLLKYIYLLMALRNLQSH